MARVQGKGERRCVKGESLCCREEVREGVSGGGQETSHPVWCQVYMIVSEIYMVVHTIRCFNIDLGISIVYIVLEQPRTAGTNNDLLAQPLLNQNFKNTVCTSADIDKQAVHLLGGEVSAQ